MADLDNTPFVGEDIDDVRTSTWRYLRHHLPFVGIVAAVVLVLEIIFFFLVGDDFTLYLLPVFVLAGVYAIIHQKIENEFMQQFAAANHYTYVEKGDLTGLDGMLFQIGHDRTVSDFITGIFLNAPFSLFIYSYTIGSGKSQQTNYATVFTLQFDTAMPDLLLEDSRRFYGDSLAKNFSDHIKLEGDFNKYFSLSIKKGYEIEALEVFTPEIMQELIERAKTLSVELVNSHLFIYANSTITKKQDLYNLYNLGQYFVQRLGPVLARMKPSLEATNQVLA